MRRRVDLWMRLSYDGSRKGDLPVMHPIPKFSHFLLARFADEVYSSDLIRVSLAWSHVQLRIKRMSYLAGVFAEWVMKEPTEADSHHLPTHSP